jgi:hypothetical protein
VASSTQGIFVQYRIGLIHVIFFLSCSVVDATAA